MQRRSFFKWMTAVGTTLLLPYNIRPSRDWSFVDTIQVGWHNVLIEGGVVRIDFRNSEGRWQPIKMVDQAQAIPGPDSDVNVIAPPGLVITTVDVPSYVAQDQKSRIRVTNHKLDKAVDYNNYRDIFTKTPKRLT